MVYCNFDRNVPVRTLKGEGESLLRTETVVYPLCVAVCATQCQQYALSVTQSSQSKGEICVVNTFTHTISMDTSTTFLVHSWYIPGTFLVHSWYIPGTYCIYIKVFP